MLESYADKAGSAGAAVARPVQAPYRVRWLEWPYVAGVLLLHVPLALWASEYEVVATIHALSVAVIGGWWAVKGRLYRVAYVLAYVAGAEVFWRMTQADVFWEYGKYLTVGLIVVAMVRARRFRVPYAPLAYFVLLLPSIWVLTDDAYVSQNRLRELVSFNLSGPLALFACAWFFSYVTCTTSHLRRLLLALVMPIIGILTNALFTTLSTTSIQFAPGSNLVTSGGYGPNQVASVLGLAALALFLYLLFERKRYNIRRGTLLGVLLLFVFQTAMTFSRSGLALAFGGGVAAIFFIVRDRRSRSVVVVVAVLLYLFVQYVMLPFMEDFTGGVFAQRYTDISGTGREEIAMMEFQTFLEHPLLGVGPGGGSLVRRIELGQGLAAHTEFTRMLSEHGILGLVAFLVIMAFALKRFKKARGKRARAVVAAAFSWVLLFALVNGFRLVAPAFLFGLACATFLLEQRPRPDEAVGSHRASRKPARRR